MSSSRSRWFGTPKQAAYSGWFSALLGGAMIGAGIAVILIVRVFASLIPTYNPNLGINPESYAALHIIGAVLIFLGFLFGLMGIFEIRYSQKTIAEKSAVSVSMEKKYCRYCGTENNRDAVFCEKCGKRISE